VSNSEAKPRTAEEVANAIVAFVDPYASQYASMSMLPLLESWRHELLADGWTYLPALPEPTLTQLVAVGAPYIVALRNMDERIQRHKWTEPGRFAGRHGWVDEDGESFSGRGAEPFAFRPLPEPPPERGE